MARHEQDREDLLAEATALVPRAELQVDGFPQTVFAGFRRDGCPSFYFGANVAYHFNAAGQLRRAFVDEALFKAEKGRLIRLGRERTTQQVTLVRHELEDAETEQFCRAADARLQLLQRQIEAGRFELIGEVPAGGGAVDRTTAWLLARPHPLPIATRPHAR